MASKLEEGFRFRCLVDGRMCADQRCGEACVDWYRENEVCTPAPDWGDAPPVPRRQPRPAGRPPACERLPPGVLERVSVRDEPPKPVDGGAGQKAAKAAVKTAVKTPGGRNRVVWRLDYLPALGLKAAGELAAYGAGKGKRLRWVGYDPEGEESGLNHALGHAVDAGAKELGSPERIDDLARVAVNALMQIELELRAAGRTDGPLTATGRRMLERAAAE